VTGDLDLDNDLDLATANGSSDTATVLKNNGLGVFTNFGAVATDTRPQSMAIGDLNNDGALDMVIVHLCGRKDTRVFLNTGLGLHTYDLNNDGRVNVVDLALLLINWVTA